MPIIGNVGRRSLSVRGLNALIHVVLIIGTVAMLYPFMIMVSGSFKSTVDSKVFNVIPRYFHDEEMLFRKYVEARYEEKSLLVIAAYRNRFLAFEFVTMPADPRDAAVEDWMAFLKETADSHTIFDYYVAEQIGIKVYPRNRRAFRDLMKKESDGDLAAANRKYGMTATNWEQVSVEENDITHQRFTGDYEGILARYKDFKLGLPLWQRVYVSLDGEFMVQELKPSYGEKLSDFNEAMGTGYPTWGHVALSRRMPGGPLGKHWAAYVKTTLNRQFIRVSEEGAGTYRSYLKEKYGDIDLLNRTYHTNYASFKDIGMLDDVPTKGAQMVDWSHFIENIVPPQYLEVTGLEFRYRDWLKTRYGTIDALNRAHGNGLVSFAAASLSGEAPDFNLAQRTDWDEFVRRHARPESIELNPNSRTDFIEYLKVIFPGDDEGLDVAGFNAAYGTSFDKTLDVYPARTLPENPAHRESWLTFAREHVDDRFLLVDRITEQTGWEDFLRSKYGDTAAINPAWGLLYEDFDSVPVDHWAADHAFFREHRSDIFWEFLKRNYLMVLDVMLYNGRAIMNTIIYCSLAILAALLVNPLAAYAMSRYKLPATYKIILVLMLTMAFPPMVMGIPQFLLIKKLGLLNTFFALILPAAADGYFIFLLKGFFDSLPQELFESATIDGASEWQIFWTIAMSLSKPIMAVIALSAFNAAYRNFMMAFILCQDSSMWTMMVHIYQLMQESSMSVGFAALVVASVPTLLVFVFCQNIIIRGIVVPTEK